MATARVHQALLGFGLAAGLILLVAAGAGFWIAYNTWRPLKALADAVRRSGTREAGGPLPVEGSSEIAQVARAFQEALEARDRRYGELASLLEASRAVVSSLDLEQSLQAIDRQASLIARASAVRLLLLDEDAQVLRFRVGMGLPPDEEKDLVVPIKESFSGQVLATGKPLAVADIRGDPRPRYPQHLTKYGLVSYLGLPVKIAARVFGVLVINTESPRTYSEAEIAYLTAFADQAAIAIANAQLFQGEQERRRQLEAIRAVSTEITRELDLSTVLGLIARRSIELVGAALGMIRLWDEARQELVPFAGQGVGDWLAHKPLRLGEGVAGTAAQRREGLLVNDFRNSPYATPLHLERTTYTAVLAEPLLYRERLVGVLALGREAGSPPFTSTHQDLLRLFAAQAAIAIKNARLHEAVQGHAAELEDRVRERTAELTSNQERFLQQIHTSGQRLLDLVTDILDFAQAEVGASRLNLESIALDPLLHAMVDLFQGPATRKRLALATALEPGLPPVVADRGKLTQILVKLLNNAVKFTPEGGRITVTARRASSALANSVEREPSSVERLGPVNAPRSTESPEALHPPRSTLHEVLEIAVTDTGIGMAPENLERIFQGFAQVDSSDTRPYEGAGLGLALVRLLVELHGGRVWAESEGEGRGARFIVRLPLLPAPPVSPA